MPASLMFRAAPALVALLMASGHAMAQSTTASEDQSENAAAAQPAVELAADTVLAVVDDTPITLGEVISVRQSLPEQYQQLPDEVLITALVQQLSDQQLLANAGHAAGLRDLHLAVRPGGTAAPAESTRRSRGKRSFCSRACRPSTLSSAGEPNRLVTPNCSRAWTR